MYKNKMIKGVCSASHGNPSQSYRASPAISDHLPSNIGKHTLKQSWASRYLT